MTSFGREYILQHFDDLAWVRHASRTTLEKAWAAARPSGDIIGNWTVLSGSIFPSLLPTWLGQGRPEEPLWEKCGQLSNQMATSLKKCRVSPWNAFLQFCQPGLGKACLNDHFGKSVVSCQDQVATSLKNHDFAREHIFSPFARLAWARHASRTTSGKMLSSDRPDGDIVENKWFCLGTSFSQFYPPGLGKAYLNDRFGEIVANCQTKWRHHRKDAWFCQG